MKICTYIKKLEYLNSIPLQTLKGYNELDESVKKKLSIISATISNELNS